MESLYELSEKGKDLMWFESIGGGSTLMLIGLASVLLSLLFAFLSDKYEDEIYEYKYYKRKKNEIKKDIKLSELKLKEYNNNDSTNELNLSNNKTKFLELKNEVNKNNFTLKELNLEYKFDSSIVQRLVGFLGQKVLGVTEIFNILLFGGLVIIVSGMVVGGTNDSKMSDYYKNELSKTFLDNKLVTTSKIIDISTSYRDNDTKSQFIILYENGDKIEKVIFEESLNNSENSFVSVINKEKLDEYIKGLEKEHKKLDSTLLNVLESNNGLIKVSVNKEILTK